MFIYQAAKSVLTSIRKQRNYLYASIFTNVSLFFFVWRWDSKVCITTRLWVGQPVHRTSITGKGKRFASPKLPHRLWGRFSFLYNGCRGGFAPRVKPWSVKLPTHLHLLSSLRMSGDMSSLPYAFIPCTDNFTFTFLVFCNFDNSNKYFGGPLILKTVFFSKLSLSQECKYFDNFLCRSCKN